MQMRYSLPALVLLAAVPARAQVTVNTNALDSLPAPEKVAPHQTTHRATQHRSATQPRRAVVRAESAAQPDLPLPLPPIPPGATSPAAPTATAALPVIPPAPPRVPHIPPPVAVPVQPAPPPPPIPVAKDAPGIAETIPHGVRVTFGANRTDLNPVTERALAQFATVAKADASVPVNVFAYAKAVPDDPSTPRRLSLSRALAARAVLIAGGIPSPRIYVRAMGGADPGASTPDRVDLVLGKPDVALVDSRQATGTQTPAQSSPQAPQK